MKYIDIIEKVSKELALPEEVVKLAYKSFWEFINTQARSLPLKTNLSEEEFSSLRTNFNIPSLGKLSCNYERYLGVRERFKYIKNLREKYEKAIY